MNQPMHFQHSILFKNWPPSRISAGRMDPYATLRFPPENVMKRDRRERKKKKPRCTGCKKCKLIGSCFIHPQTCHNLLVNENKDAIDVFVGIFRIEFIFHRVIHESLPHLIIFEAMTLNPIHTF